MDTFTEDLVFPHSTPQLLQVRSLSHLLKEPKFPSEFETEYIRLLERFEVVLLQTSQTLLIPARLSRKKPASILLPPASAGCKMMMSFVVGNDVICYLRMTSFVVKNGVIYCLRMTSFVVKNDVIYCLRMTSFVKNDVIYCLRMTSFGFKNDVIYCLRMTSFVVKIE